MKIDMYDIKNRGYLFANTVAYQMFSASKIPQEFMDAIHNGTILKTDYANEYVSNLITGCIYAYHDALRDTLLEYGIEIDASLDD